MFWKVSTAQVQPVISTLAQDRSHFLPEHGPQIANPIILAAIILFPAPFPKLPSALLAIPRMHMFI